MHQIQKPPCPFNFFSEAIKHKMMLEERDTYSRENTASSEKEKLLTLFNQSTH